MPESLRFGFVDFGGHGGPRTGVQYPLLDAVDPAMADVAVGRACSADDGAYAALLQVLTLWVEDLPDWGSNEGILKLDGRTRRPDRPDEKIDLAATLDFGVRDASRANVDFQLGFDGVLLKNRLELGLELIEIDQDPRDYYTKLKDAVGPAAGKELLSVAKGVPYLELATKVADGLIQAFGKNESDTVWKGAPVFGVTPAIGAPFLRSGVYVVYEDTRGTLTPSELAYRDQAIGRAGASNRIDRNYLLISIDLTPPPAAEIADGSTLTEAIKRAS